MAFLALDLAAPQKFAETFFGAMLLRHAVAPAAAHGRATPGARARSVAFSANRSCKDFPSNYLLVAGHSQSHKAHAGLHPEYRQMDRVRRMSANVDSRRVYFPM